MTNSTYEDWRDIDGMPYYKVNILGVVRSIDRVIMRNRQGRFPVKSQIMKRFVHKGYVYVILSHQNIRKQCLVHQLIAKAFIPNPRNLCEVNHIDNNPLNNEISNLEWVTHSENMRHAVKHDRMYKPKGELHNMHKLTEEQVLQIREMEGLTHKQIADGYNVSRACIKAIKTGRSWKHLWV